MIDFYTFTTPNGRKVKIMLEELGIPYNEHMVNLRNNEQKQPAFLAINPNGRIPAIVDTDNGQKLNVFESGAVLYYLGEKYGKFVGANLAAKAQAMQWVMFQMSGIGPNFGNYYFGTHSMPEKIPAFIERFEKESQRLLGVMERQLEKNPYLAGKDYTIADMAMYPWIAAYITSKPEWFANLTAVRRWAETIKSRPAVQKAMS